MEVDRLRSRLESGQSIEAIAREAGYSLRGGPKPTQIVRECSKHGWIGFVRTGAAERYRCKRCNSEAVAERRRRIKEILVGEAGGGCLLCGFHAYAGALQFHHREPAEKAFSLSRQGVTRSLAAARAEARKCVLLCANCHAMVEAGLLVVPQVADTLRCASAEAFGPG